METTRAYVHVATYANELFELYYDENGKKCMGRTNFKPFIGFEAPEGELTSFDGKHKIKLQQYHTLRDREDAVEKYSMIDGFRMHGVASPKVQYTAKRYPGEIVPPVFDIMTIDLEVIPVDENTGFSPPDQASDPIVCATLHRSKTDTYTIHSLKPWDKYKTLFPHLIDKIERYTHYKCEEDLLIGLVIDFSTPYPDILTGWNIDGYDVPYLVNRIAQIISPDHVKRLSPMSRFHPRTVRNDWGGQTNTYTFLGIQILDYMTLYKKYVPQGRERFSLDYIAKYELGEDGSDAGKLDYSDRFDTLRELYYGDSQLFVDYNLKDVEQVTLIDKKLDLIALTISIAYMAKVNFEDVISPVKTWEAYIYNYLWQKRVACPPRVRGQKASYVGAYVKEPLLGLHSWAVSLDVASMYPSALISNNISPEMKVDISTVSPELRAFVKKISVDALLKHGEELTSDPVFRDSGYNVTANGCLFRRESQGVLAEITQKVFQDRKDTRKLKARLEAEGCTDKNLLDSLHQKQWALKILLNSLYGAYANEFFLYFDLDLAAAITATSQLYIRSIEKNMNKFLTDITGIEKDRVIGVDTDSNYLQLSDVVEKRFKGKDVTDQVIGEFLDKFSDEVLQEEIDATFTHCANVLNSYKNYMSMKREKICKKMLVVAKKKYAFLLLDEEGHKYYDAPKIKVTGIEVVKSSTPKVVRDWLKECLNIIFNKTNAELIDFIEDKRDEFYTLPFHTIAFPRSVSDADKDPNHTAVCIDCDDEDEEIIGVFAKGTSIGTKAAMGYNSILKRLDIHNKYPMIVDGDKMKFCYIKPNGFKLQVLAIPVNLPHEFKGLVAPDYKTQFNKAFLSPLKNLLKPIGWQSERTFSFDDF